MDLAIQAVVVALIVVGSTVFAAWRLAPARLRLRLIDTLHPDTAHAWGRWAMRLRRKAAEELMHGCGACSHASGNGPKRKAR